MFGAFLTRQSFQSSLGISQTFQSSNDAMSSSNAEQVKEFCCLKPITKRSSSAAEDGLCPPADKNIAKDCSAILYNESTWNEKLKHNDARLNTWANT